MMSKTLVNTANGNMVSDTGKGIESVTYNRFNLPTRVDMSNGNYIKYVYDGRGRKLSATVYALPTHIVHGTLSSEVQVQSALVPVAPTARYHDNYMYELTRTRILIPGGYILRSGSTYTYHYYVTDYQGNVRAVIDEDGNLEEANDYYPYGMLMTADDGTFPAVQPYKYAAKEYETSHGLNLYDFGARRLNPAALAFTTPDPLCEKYYSISPYTYCAANPAMLTDPTGLDCAVIIDPENLIITISAIYYVVTDEMAYRYNDEICYAPGYSQTDINDMNTYSAFLNDLSINIDFQGATYSVCFNLDFVDGGDYATASNKANDCMYRGTTINQGNLFILGQIGQFRSVDFSTHILADGRTKTVGGVTSYENRTIIMNGAHNREFDTKYNRLHEIFHSLGVSDMAVPWGEKGIMGYPPQLPIPSDINKVIRRNWNNLIYK